MTVNYQLNAQYINFEDFEDYLELIVEIVLKPSRYILKKLNSTNNHKFNDNEKYQKNHDELISRYNNFKKEFDDNKIRLYQEMDVIAHSFKNNKLFYDEYFDFCEIQDIIKNTFDRDFSLIKNEDFEFVLDLVVNFSKIVDYKINLIKNNNFDKEIFESKYNDYLTYINKSKNYYFENIRDESIDDDLFCEYTKIIME